MGESWQTFDKEEFAKLDYEDHKKIYFELLESELLKEILYDLEEEQIRSLYMRIGTHLTRLRPVELEPEICQFNTETNETKDCI